MVHFLVDDGFYDHPKVKSIPRGNPRKGAIALWTQAGSWNSKHSHDGLIPVDQVEEMHCSDKDAQALVQARLWHEHGYECPDPKCTPVPPGYYGYHQWAGNGQRTKPQVEHYREQARVRQSRRRSRRDTDRTHDPGDPDVTA
jgi:hypothetical protein